MNSLQKLSWEGQAIRDAVACHLWQSVLSGSRDLAQQPIIALSMLKPDPQIAAQISRCSQDAEHVPDALFKLKPELLTTQSASKAQFGLASHLIAGICALKMPQSEVSRMSDMNGKPSSPLKLASQMLPSHTHV
eukprot:CAMPEP_0178393976 /NCGR_PEP_ID=MMETSP0689_2-20121128/12465_1 /TAXON_ID=160604 /ORGANISM="Amphidinium massartii, Strain CS-259" /LENGTH=133 /DNA_ID=CAMNT_0020014585 /DNA_START=745 /DNA_END=1146 /DNA_ORIENTATION=+